MSLGIADKPLLLTENLLEYIPGPFPPKDLILLKRACAFAEEHYTNVIHPTSKTYNEYILQVAKFLVDLGAKPVVVSAAVICLFPFASKQVIHDLKIEFKDEHELLELIDKIFCFNQLEWNTWSDYPDENESEERRVTLRKLYLLAIGETKSADKTRDLQDIVHFQKKERQVENLIRMLLAAATDIRILVIKLADRLHFMRFLYNLKRSEEDDVQYIILAKLTLLVYAPMAERLGLWQLKSELEDMSFRLLDVGRYKEIANKLKAKKQQRDEVIHEIKSMVEKLLDDFGIQAEVYGRAKHLYSIYKKMKAKQLELEQINDLLGIRIIVEKPEECYDVQEIIHGEWPPVTSYYNGEVGIDYIDKPKENGYQSLHTTIRIEDKTVEVQIRTHEMHEIAEYGSAAQHWRYKEDKAYRKGKTPGKPLTKDRIWSEQLAKVRKNLEKGAEPFSSSQENLSKNWIYTITPKGHIVDLPVGATPLDFAYRIHTDLGNGYIGAIVNDRSVRMNYTLSNGDIVEIRTSSTRKGPSPNWLSKRRLDDEQKDPALVMLFADVEKGPAPQWLYLSENVSKTRDRGEKDKRGDDSQNEKTYMYYVFARTRQARSKIQNWLNKHKTEEQVKKSLQFEWYPWVSWDDIKQSSSNRKHFQSIPQEAGVYEVRHADRKPEERLVIGRADNLDSRIREELVKGDRNVFPNKQRILAEVNGDTSKLKVRWATTEFHAELESMLLQRYKKRFKCLPKYVDRT
jgi:(p)ppGpp synthase/HD superfamily hydrolase